MCISCSILREKALCPLYVLYHGIRSHYKIIILSKKKKYKLKVHGRTILVHITSMAQQLYAEKKKKMLKSGKVLKHSDWVRQTMIIKFWLFFNKTI